MYFSQVELEALLGIRQSSSQKVLIRHDNTGPGQLNKSRLIQGRKDCWQHIEKSPAAKKKKIIFSEAELSGQSPTVIELALLSALADGFEVYICTKDFMMKRLSDALPINDSNEFWQKRENIMSQSEQDIKKWLAAQQLAADDYIIIDQHRYQALLTKALDGVNENSHHFRELKTKLVRNKMMDDHVENEGKQSAQELAEQFAKHKHVTMKKVFHELLIGADAIVEELKLVSSTPQKIDIAKGSKLKRIKIEEGYYNSKVHFENCSELQELEFKNVRIMHENNNAAPHKIIDFSKHLHLERLIVDTKNDAQYVYLKLDISDLSLCPLMKELKLRDYQGEFDFSTLPNLEHLEIKNSEKDLSTIAQCQNLKKLVLKLYKPKTKKLDFSLLSKLESLTLSDHWHEAVHNLQRCQELKEIIFQNSDLSGFSFVDFPKLERLVLKNNTNLDIDNLSRCSQLKELKIKENTKKSLNFDYLELNNLERLVLVNIKDIDFTKLKLKNVKEIVLNNCDIASWDFSAFPSLEKLTINNCKSTNDDCTLKCPQVKELTLNCVNMHNDALKKLNLEYMHLSQLKSLNISSCNLEKIDLSKSTKLIHLIHNNSSPKIRLLPTNVEYVNMDIGNNQPNMNHDFNPLKNMIYLSLHGALHSLSCPPGLLSLNLENTKWYNDNKAIIHIKEECKKLQSVILPKETNASYLQPLSNIHPDHTIHPSTKPQTHRIIVDELTEKNKKHPVSFYQYKQKYKIDSETGINPTAQKASGCAVMIESNKNINKKDYRIQLIDALSIDKKGNIEYTSKEEANLKEIELKNKIILPEKLKVSEKLSLVRFKGTMKYGENYPLPTLQALQDKNDLINLATFNNTEFNILWNDEHKQYYIRLKGQPSFLQNSKSVDIAFTIKENPAYEKGLGEQYNVVPNLLPEPVQSAITKLLSGIPDLEILTNEEMSIVNKIQTLYDYCRRFKNVDLSTKVGSDLDILFRIIKEHTGACRHRTEAFMLLAHYMGVPARMVFNESHAYCEVPFQDVNGIQWRRFDLGGAPSIDHTSIKDRDNAFKHQQIKMPLEFRHEPQNQLQEKTQGKSEVKPEVNPQVESDVNPQVESDVKPQVAPDVKPQVEPDVKPQVEPAVMSQMELQQKPENDEYYLDFKQMVDQESLNSIETLMHGEGNPVIELITGQSPYAVHDIILQQLSNNEKTKAINHFFINTAAEFELFLSSFAIDKQGKRVRTAGPLSKLITEGGALIINWTNFNATQITSYKSLMDSIPTLHGRNVSKNLKVIGLTNPTTTACSAFLSRAKRYYVHENFFQLAKIDMSATQTKEQNISIEIDLFEGHDWYESLFGYIELKGKIIGLKDGPLITAIKNNQPLLIVNPPKDDSEFVLLLHRIRVEKQLFFNGELIKIPNNFDIKTTTKIHEDKLVANISVQQNEYTGKQKIYIGNHNWHELFEHVSIDTQTGNANTEAGWLSLFNPNSHVFYLTDIIPHSAWQKLEYEIFDKYPDKAQQFRFLLAKGASVEQVKESQVIESKKPVPVEVKVSPPIENKNTAPKVEQNILGDELFTSVYISNSEFIAKELAVKKRKIGDELFSSGKVLDTTATVYISNDCDYLSKRLAEEKKGILVSISPKTSFSDLIYSIGFNENKNQDGNGKLEETDDLSGFNFEKKGILKALEAGQTIILNGEISPSLYQQLLPYLDSSNERVFCNNEWVERKGKLIAVIPKRIQSQTSVLPRIDHSFLSLWDYREKLITKPIDFVYFDQIFMFYTCLCELPHRGQGRPQAPIVSFHLLNRMMEALKNKERLHQHNPIKSLMHYNYPKHSEDYAYLNVVAKLYFESTDEAPLRKRKLQELLTMCDQDIQKLIQTHPWQLLNCYRGAALKKLLGNDSTKFLNSSSGNFPTLSKEAIERIEKDLLEKLATNQMTNINVTLKSSYEKNFERMQKALKDEKMPLLFLKGPAGVGKTYAVKNLKEKMGENIIIHEGKKNILAWLNDKSAKTKVLFIDEANLASPGEWEFLKGLSYDGKSIYYQGKNYTLDAQHKIVVTGNEEFYRGRAYHSYFQHHAQIIYFKKPDDEFLKKAILQPILSPFKLEAHTTSLLKIYHLAHKYNPFLPLSIRDLQSAAEGFILLNKTKSDAEALYQACVNAFAVSIAKPNQRQQFMQEIADICQLNQGKMIDEKPGVIEVAPHFYLSTEKSYILDAIKELFMQRKHLLNSTKEQGQENHHKQGVLLQGLSGLGKSTLLEKILISEGFSKDNQDPQKKYYVISGGSDEDTLYEILETAFKEGSVVIFDEFNLGDRLGEKLNHYLTGVDEEGKPAPKNGFMLLASQNHSDEAGREGVAEDLLNRIRMIEMDPFSEDELVRIARKSVNDDSRFNASQFTHAFFCIKAKYPEEINTRQFHQQLSKHINKTS